jgi:drug/metabolite transporter (DMT)-like permease
VIPAAKQTVRASATPHQSADGANARFAKWLPLVAFLACTLVWGSTWLVIKLGYEGTPGDSTAAAHARLPPFDGAALRFAIAAVILLLLQAAFRIPFPRGRVEWGVVVFTGVVLVGCDYALIYWAEQYIDSGLTSVVFAIMPLFTMIFARCARLEVLTARKICGVVISIAGVGLLSWDHLGLESATIAPIAGVLGGALASAATTVVTKKWGRGVNPITLNGFSAAIGTACLYILVLLQGNGVHFPQTRNGWFAVSYLAVFGSVVAFLLYFWLLRHWDASRAGMLSVLTPLIAVALGSVFNGEPVTPRLAAGTVLVLAGVVLAMRASILAIPFRSTKATARSEAT